MEKMRQQVQTLSLDCTGSLNYISKIFVLFHILNLESNTENYREQMQTRLNYWEEEMSKTSKNIESLFNDEITKIESFLENYKKSNGDNYGNILSEIDLQNQVMLSKFKQFFRKNSNFRESRLLREKWNNSQNKQKMKLKLF
jgi:hypothetical protein